MATDDFLHDVSTLSQSVQLAEELERRDHPHEFYFYEGLRHYFSTSADNDDAADVPGFTGLLAQMAGKQVVRV